MKDRRARDWLEGAVALAAALALAWPGAAHTGDRGTIKIATQSPLSGELAGLGEGIKLSAQLAMERFKGPVESAGFRVELAPFDDQAEPHVGVANAKIMIGDGTILAVIGHLTSAVALPASEVYREADLVMISPAATDPLITTRGLPNVNRVCGRDDAQGVAAAEFAARTLKVRSAYVVHSADRHGAAIAQAFREAAGRLGLKVLGFDATDGPNTGPILTAIGAARPALVFFGGTYDQAVPAFRQARERTIRAEFLASSGPDSPEALPRTVGGVAGTHYTTVVGPVEAYPRAGEFAGAYRRRFGREPGRFAAQAYDATAVGLRALAAAIRAAGGRMPTRAAVGEAVRSVKHRGITGAIEFDENGDLRSAGYFLYRVASDDPASRGDDRAVGRLEIPGSPPRQ